MKGISDSKDTDIQTCANYCDIASWKSGHVIRHVHQACKV